MRVLAIDWGYTYWGIALVNTSTQMSQALRVIQSTKGSIPSAQLAKTIQQWEVSALVMGLPLHSGAYTPLVQQIFQVAVSLQRQLKIALTFANESQTSSYAKSLYGSSQRVDAYAAEFIGQTYLYAVSR